MQSEKRSRFRRDRRTARARAEALAVPGEPSRTAGGFAQKRKSRKHESTKPRKNAAWNGVLFRPFVLSCFRDWIFCAKPRQGQNCTLSPIKSESATVPAVTELPGMGPAGVTKGPVTELLKMW